MEQVREIRSLQGTASQSVIAAKFSTSQANVSDIWRGKIWKEDPSASTGK